MDIEQVDGFTELEQAQKLLAYLLDLKEKNNGTPKGRIWAIAATDCEKLVSWIAYAMVSKIEVAS